MHIVIDGNIGSGKTTQLNLLNSRDHMSVRREPIDKWPLELFYNDMSRWALLLQLKILQTNRPSPANEVTVYERGLLGTRHVFWEYLLAKKLVRPEEHHVYEDAYDKYKWYPDVYIYLAKSPELAFEHIQRRGQTGDKSVTLAYMRDLDKLYVEMIRTVPCKVYIVNAEQTPEQIHAEILSILSAYTVRRQDGTWVLRHDDRWSKVSKRTPMSCTSLGDMCRVS